MRKQIVPAFFLITTIYSCKHEVIKKSTVSLADKDGSIGDSTTRGPESNAVCFETGILPVFKSNCAKSGCHDAGSRQDGYVLDSYSNIIKNGIKPGDANDSKIFKVLTETDGKKKMPQPPNPALTKVQIEMIKTWINEGAKNTQNCSTPCDTTAFTYLAGIKPIIDANCVGCHNNASAGGGLDYTSHTGLKAAIANGRLLNAINHNTGYSPMPKGGVKLSDCKITQIRKWINAGALNN